jgi:replicative DNA helicase
MSREDKIQDIVLGAILLEKSAYSIVGHILTPDDFVGHTAHIYKAIQEVHDDNLDIDLLTVTERLRASNMLEHCGGAYGVASLTNKVASTANLESHAYLLKQRSTKSQAKRLGYFLAEAEDMKVTELVEHIQKSLDHMVTNVQGSNSLKLVDIMDRELEERKLRKGGMQGVPSGLTEWDNVIGGVYPGVHVVAARPAMGKTAFAVSVMIQACQTMPVCMWSGEMTADKVFLRIESNISGIPTNRLRVNEVHSDELQELDFAHAWCKDARIEVDDTPNLNINQLRVKCMKWKAEHGKFMLVMDYLGLMDDGGDEYKGVTYNSKRIHQIANEFEIPILLLHQLSRNVESRPLKMPELSDLRGSGGIEQDADTVTFLYRPHYYQLPTDPATGQEPHINDAYALVRKNREGRTGDIPLTFEGHRSRFSN